MAILSSALSSFDCEQPAEMSKTRKPATRLGLREIDFCAEPEIENVGTTRSVPNNFTAIRIQKALVKIHSAFKKSV